ncbi:MAG: hypothetical protein H0U39_04150 [Segetibacter sp.]|nr:hypothetical protein [Segetibacter sp.]
MRQALGGGYDLVISNFLGSCPPSKIMDNTKIVFKTVGRSIICDERMENNFDKDLKQEWSMLQTTNKS